MAKPDKPLLSLGATGTIANTLTFQRQGKDHIVREKPIPRDPYSLNQAYQRWDYQDYAYLWTLLSNPEKQVYRTAASRYHITGFSLWMREHLKDLPDIVARYHLDEKSGALAYDTSRNSLNATLFGASPAAGAIDGGYHSDGLNDHIDPPDSPLFNFGTDPFSIELFLQQSTDRLQEFIVNSPLIPLGYFIAYVHANQRLLLEIRSTDTNEYFSLWSNSKPLLNLTHVVLTRDDPAWTWYFNGVADGTANDARAGKACDFLSFHLARKKYRDWWHGLADHYVIYNRALDPTEILRHSKRRYPA